MALKDLLFWRRISKGELFRFSIISKNIIIVHLRGIPNFIKERKNRKGRLLFMEGKHELLNIFEENFHGGLIVDEGMQR